MVGMGTTTSIHSLTKRFKEPAGLIVAWMHQFCILPFFAYLIAEIFNFNSIYSVALKIQSMCPGGTNSNVLCFLGMADVPLSIACTTLSSISALFMMPLWIFVYLPDEESIDFGESIINILIGLAIVIGGTGVGIFLVETRPELAEKISTYTGPVLLLLLIMVFAQMGADGTNPFDPKDPANTITGSFLLPVLASISTLFWASVVGIPKPQRIAVSLETSVQNTPLCLALLYQIYDGDDESESAIIPVLYGIGSGIYNIAVLVIAYNIGWSYAVKDKTICENFALARQAMVTGVSMGSEEEKAITEMARDAEDPEIGGAEDPETVDLHP